MQLCLSLIRILAAEKTRSHSADIRGMEKRSSAICDSIGNWPS
jgi:hypothetical protein